MSCTRIIWSTAPGLATWFIVVPLVNLAMLLPISSSPLVSVIVPATEKLIVSPLTEAPMASRNEPAPLSLRLLTVRVAAGGIHALSVLKQGDGTGRVRTVPAGGGIDIIGANAGAKCRLRVFNGRGELRVTEDDLKAETFVERGQTYQVDKFLRRASATLCACGPS